MPQQAFNARSGRAVKDREEMRGNEQINDL
jgi:hypothetical protein